MWCPTSRPVLEVATTARAGGSTEPKDDTNTSVDLLAFGINLDPPNQRLDYPALFGEVIHPFNLVNLTPQVRK